MGTVSEIRRTVIPEELYQLVFGLAVGDYEALYVTVVDKAGKVFRREFNLNTTPKQSAECEVRKIRN